MFWKTSVSRQEPGAPRVPRDHAGGMLLFIQTQDGKAMKLILLGGL